MDRIITLDEKEFLICQELDVRGNHYIYAVSIEKDEYTLLIEKKENGVKTVESVTNPDEISEILMIIAKENI